MDHTLGQTIEAAVDTAAKADSAPGQEPTSSPASKASPSDSPASAGLPDAPAKDSGSESNSTSRTEGAPTTQGADDEILRDEKWLTLDARRTILTNARTKAASAERDRLLNDLGIPANELEAAREHTRAMYADPVAYYQAFGDMLRRSGLLREEPATRASAQSTARQTQAAEALSDFALPDPTFQTADGRGVYSQEDMRTIVTGLLGHVRELVGKELHPIRAERISETAKANASTEFHDAANTWPKFRELVPRMREIFAEQRRMGNTSYTLRNAYEAAYVLQDLEDAPKREAAERERLAQQTQQRPKADIAVPGASAVRESKRKSGPRSMDDVWNDALDKAAREHGVQLR